MNKEFKLVIPTKSKDSGKKSVNVQCRISEEKNDKFEKVKSLLGGYSNQELLDLMIDQLIGTYYEEDSNDGESKTKAD